MTANQGVGSWKYLALTAMVFAVSMTFIDQTIVSIAAPDIQSELRLSSTGLQWVVNGYLLALAAFFALGGRISDILGHKKMVLVGVVVFAVASALCGATPANSWAETWIVFWRVIQGIGASILFPAALAIVVSAFDIRERGRALAIFFGVSGGLTAIGPILGGWLTQYTWRAIFWVNIPVAIIAIVLTLLARTQTRSRRERLDYVGAVLVAAGMGLSVYGLQQTTSWGWGSALAWVCIVGGLILLAIFVYVERQTPIPLIRVEVFRDRAFSVDNAVLFFIAIAFIPLFFFASIYAQLSLGLSASGAGLYLLTYFAGFAVSAQIGGRMLDSIGPKQPIVLGCLIGAVGYALWAWKITDLSQGSQWPYIVLAGAGVGFCLGPASTDAVNRSINASYGEVTGITQTVRNYASSLGLAILGAILINSFTSRLTTSLDGLGIPREEASSIANAASKQGGGRATDSMSAAPPQVREAIENAVKTDLAHSMQIVFYGMAAAMVVALLIAVFHPGGRSTGNVAVPDTPAAPR